MSKAVAKIELAGAEQLRGLFSRLPRRVADRVLKRATHNAALPIERAIRRLAPVDSGILQKSITRKTVYYRAAMMSVTMIGPRSQKVMREGRTRPVNPARYVNPVNAGYRNPASKDFVARGFAQGMPASRARFEQQFAKALFSEAGKLK